MLKSNLKVLLAERDLKITKVSKDTGISRTTLTSLTFGYAKGVQFETINTLCNYLKISPNDLFLYVPYDIEITLNNFSFKINSKNNHLNCNFIVTDENKKNCFISTAYISNSKNSFHINIKTDKEDFKNIRYYLKNLPIQFLVDIENRIKKIFLSKLNSSDFYTEINKDRKDDDKIKEKDIIVNIEWDF